MADRTNRLWAGVAVGLIAAMGLVVAGTMLWDRGDGASTAAEGEAAFPDSPELEAGGVGGDAAVGMADGTESDRSPALLVIVPEDLAAGAALDDTTTTTTTLATSTTAIPITAAPITAAPTTEPPTTEPPTSATEAPGSTTASTAPPATPAPTAPPSGDDRAFEQQVLDLTNAERRKAGCPDLTNNAKLHTAALAHSTDMATKGYFSHTGANGSSMSDRAEAQGYAWRALAENIAAGYRTPDDVVTGWMNSSGHRANILDCGLTEIGVGFYDYHWTQDFGTPR